MIKKIFILIFMILLTVYVAVAVTVFNSKPENQTCEGMELIIKDSVDYGFISQREILRLLNTKKLSPIGKKIGSINTRKLETELQKHSLIANVECYRTPSNKIGIEVTQRIPILRIMADNGENYYLDIDGQIMPVPHSSANVAIVTGQVSKAYAQKNLVELGMFLQQNTLWNAQVQQIHVTPTQELEIVPRIGNHIIFLGKPGRYEEKFQKLKTFYEKGLNKVGWNKYSRISLEFNNQIICTKKEK